MKPDEFAHAAHELNNVLQVLTFRSEKLLNTLEAWDPIRLAVEEIDAEIDRAAPLLRQMIQAAEMQPVNREPRPQSAETGFHADLERVSLAKYKLSDPQKPTLLYVDDHPERLVVLKAVLESTGYQVLTADSALKGLEIFLAEPVDLVVLDYYMPSMDGGAVATKMRRLRPSVPIIIFSGALTLPELVIAMVDGFISTSDEPELLLQKISELLNHVQAQAS
jgi:CheY-like chemotaxis protein